MDKYYASFFSSTLKSSSLSSLLIENMFKFYFIILSNLSGLMLTFCSSAGNQVSTGFSL